MLEKKERKIIFTGMCVYNWHELFSDGWQQGDGQKMSSTQLLLCNIFSLREMTSLMLLYIIYYLCPIPFATFIQIKYVRLD